MNLPQFVLYLDSDKVVLINQFYNRNYREMKKDIHPTYQDAIVSCACGEVWHIKSTRPEYKVGICAKCHPFFTGKQKFVDTAGRIDKFNRRYKKAQ